MKIWFFPGQWFGKVNDLGTIEISYNIFDLRHMSKVVAHFQKKTNCFIYSFKYTDKESEKIFKKRSYRAFRTLPNMYDGAFLRK